MTAFTLGSDIYPPWSDEYVAYNAILEGLTAICKGGHWTEKDENEFESAIRVEAGKVNLFIIRKQRELETRFAYCKRTLARAKTENVSIWRSANNTIKGILKELAELNRYVRVNYNALESLIDEHTKLTDMNQRNLLVEVCRDRGIDNQRFDDFFVNVCSLSDVSKRKIADNFNTKQKQSISARFWIHTDNVTELKAMLLFHMPIQVIAPGKYFEQSAHSRTIVYFDNDDFKQYTTQLQFDDGAELTNISWCNDIATINGLSIYHSILNKTKDGALPTSDQIMLSKSHINDFLSLNYSPEDLARDLRADGYSQDYIDISSHTAQLLQQSIMEKQICPKVQVQMDRLLFLSPEDPAFYLALNTDVTFTKLDGAEMEWGNWFRRAVTSEASSDNRKMESYKFPHAILELQLDIGNNDTLPSWLVELLDSKLIYEVPRFTMFAQGVAQLWRSQLPILPWWLMHLDLDIRRATQDRLNMKGEEELLEIENTSPSREQHYVGYLETWLRRRINEPTTTSAKMPQLKTDLQGHGSTSYTQTYQAKSVSCSSSFIHHTPSASLSSDVRFRQNAINDSDGHSTFLDYYYDGRSGISQAYLLQRVETVKEDDQLRKDTIIQMEEEEKRLKKEKKKQKKKEKGQTLEPKIFFANERVFLKYLQFAALIVSAALTLLNFGDYVSTIAGATFFAIATVIAIYSTFRYRLRSYQIKTFPTVRYDDRYGPVGLCALLIGAMVLNFVLRWEHPSATNTYLGTSNQTQQQNNQQP